MKARDSKALYKSLFDNTLDGLAYCKMIFGANGDPVDFKYLDVNGNFETLTGLKKVIGKKVTELIPGIRTSNPELFEIYGRVALTGKPERFETHLKRLARWFLISAYSAKKNFFVAVFQNITEAKRTTKDLEDARRAARNVLEDLEAEKDTLAETTAKSEAILSSMAAGCIAVDTNNTIILINEVAQELLGYSKKEAMGKSSDKILRTVDETAHPMPPEKMAFPAALSAGTTTAVPANTYSFYYVKRSGTRFPVSRVVSPIVLRGKVIGAVDIFRDVSREKAMDRAKSEFVSLASHQLRTPPSIIGWYTEMLQSGDLGPVNPKQAEYLKEIYRANKRMVAIITSLLNISRIEMGTFLIAPKETDLKSVIDEAIKELSSRFNRTIEIKKNYGPELGTVNVDPDIIGIIIDNLLSNSFKYSPAENAVIEITVKRGADSLVISMKDNGIGIPSEDKNKVFEKMFRAGNAVNAFPDGTGLGLYMTRRLVMEGLGGKIWFESKENEGATFYVSLPVSGMEREKTGTTKLLQMHNS
jgi:PAS domain S-box-containing protein